MTTAPKVVITENGGCTLRSVREQLEGLHAMRQFAPKDHQDHLRETQIGTATSAHQRVQSDSDAIATAVSHKII